MDKLLFTMLCLIVVGVAIAFEPAKHGTAVEPPRVVYVVCPSCQDNCPLNPFGNYDPPAPVPTPEPYHHYYYREQPEPRPYNNGGGCGPGGCGPGGCSPRGYIPGDCLRARTGYAFPILGAPFRWIGRGFLRLRYRAMCW